MNDDSALLERKVESEYTTAWVELGPMLDDIWLRFQWEHGPHSKKDVLYNLTRKEAILLARHLLALAVEPDVPE